jgi:uncharacterized membrane protein
MTEPSSIRVNVEKRVTTMMNNEPLQGLSVKDIKRVLPFAGAVMVLFGLVRRTPFSFLVALAGGGLVYQSARQLLGQDSRWKIPEKGLPTLRTLAQGQGIRIEKEVTIDRPADELYRYWRNLENLPNVMSFLERVDVINPQHSHWVAKAPAGMVVEWDAEIINEVENQLIGWRSTDGADVSNAGSVHFEPAPSGHGTVVRVHLKYDPPAGQLGALVAKLYGTDPDQTVEQDLRRFKHRMETDDAMSGVGQPAQTTDGRPT